MIQSIFRKLARSKTYIALTFVIFLLTFVQWTFRWFDDDELEDQEVITEQYSFELEALNSIDNLSNYIDSVSSEKGIDMESPEEYVRLIDGIIRERFYHGGSAIDFRDNYIAWIAGKLIWSHFLVGVTPDEILSHPNALCSQSAIVFQEIVKEKGFNVRAVGLKRHFCSEVYYEGAWHFIDSDKEPIFDEVQPIPSVDELSKDEQLIARAYLKDTDNVSMEQLREIFDGTEILFFNENEFPAKNMRLFQRSSKFLSDFLWLFLAIPILVTRLSSGSKEKIKT